MLDSDWPALVGVAVIGTILLTGVLIAAQLAGWTRMASTRSSPDADTLLEPPGLLGLNYGRQTPAVTLLAHLVYGAVLGWALSAIVSG